MPDDAHKSQRFFPVRLRYRDSAWEAVPTGDASLYGLAAAIGAHSAAVTRLAVRAARAGADRPFASALNEAERIYLRELAGTEDMKEGLAAFAQKRAPAWRNR